MPFNITFLSIAVLASTAGGLLILFALLMCSPHAYAETFIAVKDGDWDNPSTWKAGSAPPINSIGHGDTVIIPTRVILTDGPDSLYNSGEIIVNNGGIFGSEIPIVNTLDGIIRIERNGNIYSYSPAFETTNMGKIYNAGLVDHLGSDVFNYGIINNTGSFNTDPHPYGNIHNYKNGTIVNYNNMSLFSIENEGIIANRGNMWVDGLSSFNSGKMNNTGSVTITETWDPSVDSFVNTGIFNNFKGGKMILDESSTTISSGIIQNDGIIEVSRLLENNGYLINSAIGIINNTGTIRNAANMDNLGIIHNQKVLDNAKTGIINNTGKIKNSGEIKNAGTLNNSNTIDNTGVITILNSGRLVNSAYINNNSNVVQGQKGKIINSSGILINAGLVR